MKRRYRVEAQARDATTWQVMYYSDSLPVAKRHAVAMARTPKIRATRVVNRITGQVMVNEQG